MTNPQDYIGKYQLVNSQHFEEYMKEVGVGLLTRKAAAHLKPTLEIRQEGDIWHANQYSTFKNIILSFRFDEEFNETTADGRSFKSTVTFKDGKIIHVQKKIKSSDKDSHFEYFFEGDKLILTLQSGNVICRREFIRQ